MSVLLKDEDNKIRLRIHELLADAVDLRSFRSALGDEFGDSVTRIVVESFTNQRREVRVTHRRVQQPMCLEVKILK